MMNRKFRNACNRTKSLLKDGDLSRNQAEGRMIGHYQRFFGVLPRRARLAALAARRGAA